MSERILPPLHELLRQPDSRRRVIDYIISSVWEGSLPSLLRQRRDWFNLIRARLTDSEPEFIENKKQAYNAKRPMYKSYFELLELDLQTFESSWGTSFFQVTDLGTLGHNLHLATLQPGSEYTVYGWIEKNIRAIQRFESLLPGGVKTLHEFYNLTNFARYPVVALVDMLKKHQVLHPQWVLCLTFNWDDKTVYVPTYHETHLLAKLLDHTNYRRLYLSGSKKDVVIRYAEIGSLSELSHLFQNLSQFSPSNIGVVVEAHGNHQIIRINETELLEQNSPHLSELASGIKQITTEQARVILTSCFAGCPGGVAEAFASLCERVLLTSTLATESKVSVTGTATDPFLQVRFADLHAERMIIPRKTV